MLNLVSLLAVVSLLSTDVEAGKCFHNTVPFLTKQSACATMGNVTLANACLQSPYPPLFYIPQYLTSQVTVAQASFGTSSSQYVAARTTAAIVLANYTGVVLNQESLFYNASVVANQTCINQGAPALDLVGAQKKLQQALNNYQAAYQSNQNALNLETALGIPHKKKRDYSSVTYTCGTVAYETCPYTDAAGICQCSKWFNCLNNAARNCFNGMSAYLIQSNMVVSSAPFTTNTSPTCAKSNFEYVCGMSAYNV